MLVEVVLVVVLVYVGLVGVDCCDYVGVGVVVLGI